MLLYQGGRLRKGGGVGHPATRCTSISFFSMRHVYFQQSPVRHPPYMCTGTEVTLEPVPLHHCSFDAVAFTTNLACAGPKQGIKGDTRLELLLTFVLLNVAHSVAWVGNELDCVNSSGVRVCMGTNVRVCMGTPKRKGDTF